MTSGKPRWVTPFKHNFETSYQDQTSISLKSVKLADKKVDIVLEYDDIPSFGPENSPEYVDELYRFARQAMAHDVDRRIEVTLVQENGSDLDSFFLEPEWCNDRYPDSDYSILDQDPDIDTVHRRLIETSERNVNFD